MKKNILLTGANGQLGSEIRKISADFPLFAFFATDIDNLDICKKNDVEEFIKANKIDFIINCAAYTAVDKAESDTDLCYKINRDAVKNIAEASGQARIIHISTDYVFDGNGNVPLKETDRTNPQSVYGASKLAGEEALQAICPDRAIIIRTAWLYSSFGNNFVKTMRRLGREKESLNVVNDQFGTPTYAADLAAAILHILTWTEKNKSFPAGIYHYTDEGVCTWYDFTLKIHQIAGITDCKVHPVPASEYPTAAHRPAYSVLDKTKIKTSFALTIPEWQDSLQRCLTIKT
jgi:dTDP-4-dehydrorhamnose reductase